MSSSSSLYTPKKLLLSIESNTTVQTCLNLCNHNNNNNPKNDTVLPRGLCPAPCLAICPSVCHFSISTLSPPHYSPSQPNTPFIFSPLFISLLVILPSIFLFITFYAIYLRHFRRRRKSDSLDEEHGDSMVRRNPTVERECAVCLGEFVVDDELRVLGSCNHLFHVHCIDLWLMSHLTCPLCRVPIVSPTDHHDHDHDCDDREMVDEVIVENKEDKEGGSVEEDKESSSQRRVLEQWGG